MRPLCFKTAGISTLLCGLDNNKAPGPDGIHPRILRQLNLAIAPTLQVIFEKTIQKYREGVVPADWRRANICPIYKKKGARKDLANYRPISLTCIASKLFEHIVTSYLMGHLGNHASCMRSSTVSGRADPVKASCLSSHTTCSMVSMTESRQT